MASLGMVIQPVCHNRYTIETMLREGGMACNWVHNQGGIRYDLRRLNVICNWQYTVLAASNDQDRIGDIWEAIVHLQQV